MPTIQGQVSTTETPNFYDVIDQNPDRYAKLSDVQKRNLADDFFQKKVAVQPGFDQLEPQKQDAVKQDFYKKYQIPDLPDLRNQMGPVGNFINMANAQDAKLAHEHPIFSAINDVVSGKPLRQGFLQGLTAGGYTPGGTAPDGVAGIPQQAANIVLGQPLDNPASNALRGLGQVAGGLMGGAPLSTVLTPFGAGALYGGANSINQQADQGKPINYLQAGGQAALMAGAAGLGPVGNSLPTKIATGGLVGGTVNSASQLLDQYFNNGKIDLRDPAVLQAFLQGAGPGAGFGAMHPSAPIKEESPISVSQARQPLQGRVEERVPSYGLDKKGQRALGKAMDFGRKNRYQEAVEQRRLQQAERAAARQPQMSVEDYYNQKAEELFNRDQTAKKTEYNARKQLYGKIRRKSLQRQDRYAQTGREYMPNDRQQEAILMHEAMERMEQRRAQEQKNKKAIQDAQDRTEKRTSGEQGKARKAQLDALRKDIQERSAKQRKDEEAGAQILAAVKEATKVPEPKTSKQIERKAPGKAPPDEYKEMANEQKERSAKQRNRQEQPAKRAKGDSPYKTPFVASKKSGKTELATLPNLHDSKTGVIHASAVVRMHEGHLPTDFEEGYGAAKIQDKHGAGLAKAGFPDDPAGMAEHILNAKDRKYYWDDNHKSLVVVKPGVKSSDGLAIELVLDKEGHYYSIKTMGHWREGYFKSKRELTVGPAQTNAISSSDGSALASGSLKTTGKTGPGGENVSSQYKNSTSENTLKPPQQLSNPGNFKTSPQEAHPSAKTLTALLKDKKARADFEKLPKASQDIARQWDQIAGRGNRAELYEYEPKTGQLSSNEEEINTEGGKKDKITTPLGISYNPKTGEFAGHALNNNFENRQYIIPGQRVKYGLRNIVETEKPGLVGKYANAHFQPGSHVELNAHVEAALRRLPQSDLNALLDVEGDVSKIKGLTRKRLREAVQATGDKRSEVFNYVQEVLTNRAKLDQFIEDRLPDTLKNLGEQSGDKKIDFLRAATEYAKADPVVKKAIKARIDCRHGR